MSLLSYGNTKLPRTTAIFNLPSIETCPGSTETCRKFCYAKQSEAMYPSVMPFRKRNLEASREDNFVSLISLELASAMASTKKNPINAVRIHESGDFYSQEYLDKWISIASSFPSLDFYAYTRSWMLDFSKAPSNLRIISSIDPTSHYKAWYISNHYAFMGEDTNCLNKSITCPGSCKTCNYCWNGKVSQVRVVFKIHGTRAKGRRVKKEVYA